MKRRWSLWIIVALALGSMGTPVRAGAELVLTITPAHAGTCRYSSNTITARVTTSDGQPVANQEVVFSLLAGTGTLTPTHRQTSSDGSAVIQYYPINFVGLVVIAADITGTTGLAQRAVTSILVDSYASPAQSLTILSNPGVTVVGDLATMQLSLAKEGSGAPAVSLIRLSRTPFDLRCTVNPPLPLRSTVASAYTMAHLDRADGVTALDLTFAYTDPGQPVALRWWDGQRWRIVDDAVTDPATSTLHLRVTPATALSVASLTAVESFFVVVPLTRHWLPLLAAPAP